MLKKLTKQQINEIRDLYEKGEKSQKELGKIYGITKQSVNYHLNADVRVRLNKAKKENYNKLSKEEKRQLYNKYKSYYSNYFKTRYNNDPMFRAKHIERVKRSKKMKGGKKSK